MGCTSSNTGDLPQLLTNEQKICRWEKELKLPAISAQTKINLIASKQEAKGHIAEKNLSEYSDLMKCPPKFRIFKSEKDNIMEQLYKKDNRADHNKFKILVILLSKGTVKQKATLLHDVYQVYGENLRARNVELLLNDIAHVSVHLIWAAMGKKMSQIPEAVLKSYESKLLEGKPLFIESSMRLILQGRAFIPKSAFIKQVVKCPNLVSASGVRSLILKEYNDYYFLLSKNKTLTLPTEDENTPTSNQVTSQDSSPRTGFTSVEATPRHTMMPAANANRRSSFAGAKRSFSIMDPNNWKNEGFALKPKLIGENTLLRNIINKSTMSLIIPEEIDSNNTSMIDIQLTPNNENEDFSFKNELDTRNSNDILISPRGSKNNDAQDIAIKITEPSEPSDSIKISNENKEQFESVKIELPSQWNVESSDRTKDSYTTTVVVSKEMVEQVKVLVTKKIKRRRPGKSLI